MGEGISSNTGILTNIFGRINLAYCDATESLLPLFYHLVRELKLAVQVAKIFILSHAIT